MPRARGLALLVLLALPWSAPRAVRAEDPGPPAAAVLVLGRRQLLEPPGGFAAFCEANVRRPRRELRAETIEALRRIAAEEQPRLREALPFLEEARSLWVVNALVATLTPEQVERARASEHVRAVFQAGNVPEADDAGKVERVTVPRRRRRFSVRGKEVTWNLERLDAPRAWTELGATGEGVVVAMFDMGVNYEHEDLIRNLWVNPDETPNNRRDDDGNGAVDDLYGFDFSRMKAEVEDRHPMRHGTLTTGLAVGDGTGGTITGVAPRARFMSLVGWGGIYPAARAFEYALVEGADVVNMSFSIPGLGEARGLWRLMSEQAVAAGLVLVSGAGNFQRTARVPAQIRIPEGIPCVICAGGVTRDLGLPGFVSLGPVEWGSVPLYGDFPLPEGLVKPDVCAFPGPGVGLLRPAGSGYLPEENPRHGNSLSAPQVSGVAALVLSVAPDLPAWRVKAILEATATDLDEEGKDPRTGAGLVNAFRAVKRAIEETGGEPPTATER